jgi:hypothetical protein
VLHAWIFYLANQVVGLMAPRSMNLNVAHDPWEGMPIALAPWLSRGLNAAGALLFLLGAAAVARAYFARYGRGKSTAPVEA